MRVCSKTDIGRIRSTNQDAVKSGMISDELVWSVVCDGMGGVHGGDVASEMAVLTISSVLSESLSEMKTDEEIKDVMLKSVFDANGAIYMKSRKDKNLRNMGTTVVVCVLSGQELYVVHVGDSRAYIVKEKEIQQVTTDHSIVQSMLDNGEISEIEAKNHPQKNIITRALGVDSQVEPDYFHTKIDQEDLVLLCTDGLTNCVEDSEIYDVCKNNPFKFIPEALVKISNNHGGNDNITVSVIACD